jgi:hypothetical protein
MQSHRDANCVRPLALTNSGSAKTDRPQGRDSSIYGFCSRLRAAFRELHAHFPTAANRHRAKSLIAGIHRFSAPWSRNLLTLEFHSQQRMSAGKAVIAVVFTPIDEMPVHAPIGQAAPMPIEDPTAEPWEVAPKTVSGALPQRMFWPLADEVNALDSPTLSAANNIGFAHPLIRLGKRDKLTAAAEVEARTRRSTSTGSPLIVIIVGRSLRDPIAAKFDLRVK